MLPWGYPPKKPLTPREGFLEKLSEGVPPELCCRAYGFDWNAEKDKPEVAQAMAVGEILLFERARDGGVSGAVRAAMRHETKTWTPKAEPASGLSLEDYLRD